MKILLGIVIGAGLLLGVTAYAGIDIPTRNLGVINGSVVVKFVDPDNGYVCYVTDGTYSGGISCLKP